MLKLRPPKEKIKSTARLGRRDLQGKKNVQEPTCKSGMGGTRGKEGWPKSQR